VRWIVLVKRLRGACRCRRRRAPEAGQRAARDPERVDRLRDSGRGPVSTMALSYRSSLGRVRS